MALMEKFLVVKPSTLPGAGKGLFTKTFIPAGTRIVEYKGRLTTWKDVEHDHGNAYIFTVHEDHVIDAARSYKAFARYANDARGFTRVKGITNNCIYFRDEDDRVYLESKRDIPAGSEIFVSYGNDYWKVMRENRKVELENEKAAKQKKTTRKKIKR
jgi:SET domain-containing protein